MGSKFTPRNDSTNHLCLRPQDSLDVKTSAVSIGIVDVDARSDRIRKLVLRVQRPLLFHPGKGAGDGGL